MSRRPEAPPPPPGMSWTSRAAAVPSLVGDGLLVALAVALVLVELRPVFVEGSAAAGPYRIPDAPAGVLLLAAVFFPVLTRRRWPLASAVVGLTAALVLAARAYAPFGAVELVALLLVYSAARHGRAIPRVAAFGALAAWLLAREAVQPFGFHLPGYAIEFVVFGGAWALGEFVRFQRRVADQLTERATLLDRERAAREREAAHGERMRIARELHDVIAHHLAVIVIQSQVADAALSGDGPGAAHDALTAIEENGREALTEMRHTLGLLRQDEAVPGASGERSPQPGLDHLDALVAQLGRAGLDVEVAISGERVALPRPVDLSAYRIVQEALTNSLRHSAATGRERRRRAAVHLRYERDRLLMEITDSGEREAVHIQDAVAPRDERADGIGQIGMRERVALLGGELAIGYRGDGGYGVRVLLPLMESVP